MSDRCVSNQAANLSCRRITINQGSRENRQKEMVIRHERYFQWLFKKSLPTILNALNMDLTRDRRVGRGIFHTISGSQLSSITNWFTAGLTRDAVVLQTIPEESGKSQLLMNKLTADGKFSTELFLWWTVRRRGQENRSGNEEDWKHTVSQTGLKWIQSKSSHFGHRSS